jgi:probable DNA metabolism protein
LKKHVSGYMLSQVWFALLASDHDARYVDLALWHTLASVWKQGCSAEADLADEHVNAVLKAALRTGGEYNKYLGLVRFRDVGGIFYSELEPECDVLTLLADHFSGRLPGQSWVLHDLRRKKAAVHDGRGWFITNIDLSQIPPSTEEDQRYQELWREFYRSTTTRQRLNAVVQRGHMPKKYWKYLVENPGQFHGKRD